MVTIKNIVHQTTFKISSYKQANLDRSSVCVNRSATGYTV